MMRHTLGYLSLEFYMTLMYKARQEVLQRLDQYHPAKTRRDIVQHLSAKRNFDQQFTKLIGNMRTLISEQMIYSEKAYYWNSNLGEEEAAELSKSEMTSLFHIKNYQNDMSLFLENYGKLLKAKRKFYIDHILPGEMKEDETQNKNKEQANGENLLTGVENNSEG